MSYDPTPPARTRSTMTARRPAAGRARSSARPPTGFTTFSTGARPERRCSTRCGSGSTSLQTVFVTAGKQHVRWGTGRFWQPTDYLHPLKRNPLDVFDARAGTSMLKLHVPWEDKGWNFYGVRASPRIPTDATATPAARSPAGGARRDRHPRRGARPRRPRSSAASKPRFGIDISTGIGDFDVYADVAIRVGRGLQRRRTSCPDDQVPICRRRSRPGTPIADRRPPPPRTRVSQLSGVKTQAVVGVELVAQVQRQRPVHDRRRVLLQPAGYSDASLYPGLLLEQHRHAAAELLLHRAGTTRRCSRRCRRRTPGTTRPSRCRRSGNLSDHVVRVPPRLLADGADPPLVRGVRGRPLRLHGRRVPPRRGLRPSRPAR